MKRSLLITTVLILMTAFFVVNSNAAIEKCDLNYPKDGDVDGLDLAKFAAFYAAANYNANVDGVGGVGLADVAHFAGFFGQTYTVSTRRPNILLIIADDVGLDVTTNLYPDLITDLIALYGPSPGHNHPNYQNINGRPASLPVLTDRLADQGMVFANTWAQPLCSPTRATVVTGLFEDKTRVLAPGVPMSSYHTTFVQKLKNDAGYSTALFGKWHLGAGGSNGVLPKQSGFDLYKGNNGGGLTNFWNYDYHVQDDATTDPTTYRSYNTSQQVNKSLPGIGPTKFATVVQAADTIEWINARQAENPDKPWFVYLAFNEAHSPMHVPNADTLDTTSYNEMLSCGGTFGTANLGSCNNKQLTRAMSNALDTVVGKVLDAVESLGSDTYVIFIGDNGTDVSTTSPNSLDNMYITTAGRGKGSVYESGARVPMAVRGPGIAAGNESTEFVHVADLFATVLTLAGLTPPQTNKDNNNNDVASDSKSLTPILFGSASAVRDPDEGYLLTETNYNGNKVGARNGEYKVVCNGGTTNCGFYNLIDDPLEEYPLSKPGSCTNYRSTWNTFNPEWHYCRLIEVVTNYSIF
jgi:arylsulfatase A-like enzyme